MLLDRRDQALSTSGFACRLPIAETRHLHRCASTQLRRLTALSLESHGHFMLTYRAVFLRRNDQTREPEACLAHALAATTIQGAIDEALALPRVSKVSSIDIFAGDDKVENR